MRIAILLSASRHPVSGRPVLAATEARAIGLALRLGGEVAGFHAGPGSEAARLALGHGLPRLVHLRLGGQEDPLPALHEALAAFSPRLILCGRRAEGGDETGLLPYRLAARLGAPILADAVEIAGNGGHVVQALARGGRRRLPLPAGAVVITVHPAAPPAGSFAFALQRRGAVETREAAGPVMATDIEERTMRRRGKLMAAPGAAPGKSGERLVDPEAEEAARAILAHLERIGVLR
ncbi:electron transfer flavoprotein subunit beta [Aureimonas populi]|uniref:Electron transfer flavoprotein subunit beta n=1 Tax=Aureimonas populi TaxID=1701758 RepID=A0ABW5CI20_9HYPH|nr:electron transfer flavoprotein subunit beta [Aureimonas populi]